MLVGVCEREIERESIVYVCDREMLMDKISRLSECQFYPPDTLLKF